MNLGVYSRRHGHRRKHVQENAVKSIHSELCLLEFYGDLGIKKNSTKRTDLPLWGEKDLHLNHLFSGVERPLERWTSLQAKNQSFHLIVTQLSTYTWNESYVSNLGMFQADRVITAS